MDDFTKNDLEEFGILPTSEDKEESNTAPDDEEVSEDSQPTDPEPDEEQDNQEAEPDDTESSEPDTLTIADKNTKVKYTDADGNEVEAAWHEILGGTQLKHKYDEWVESEKKPLEEKAQSYDQLIGDFQEDPAGFLAASLDGVDVTSDLIQKVVQLGKAQGVIPEHVEFFDTYEGDTWEPTPPEQHQMTAQEKRLEQQYRQMQQELFIKEHQLQKAMTLPRYQDKGLTPEVVKRADDLYYQIPQYYNQAAGSQQLSSGYEVALRQAMFEMSNFTPQRPSVPEPKQQPKSRHPGSPRRTEVDKEEEELIKFGVLKSG